ncbi:hypothetical protein M0R45_026210 [Rubus argutus]|uniref:Uncharacterized protein n=1 Tax=Rubus argutus TaxID=59490 RepID=A0AAW1WWW5_RUBAR
MSWPESAPNITATEATLHAQPVIACAAPPPCRRRQHRIEPVLLCHRSTPRRHVPHPIDAALNISSTSLRATIPCFQSAPFQMPSHCRVPLPTPPSPAPPSVSPSSPQPRHCAQASPSSLCPTRAEKKKKEKETE